MFNCVHLKSQVKLLFTYTIIQSITSSEMCSLHLAHPSAHTLGAVDTHTHINTHTWSSGDTHTHTWSSGHCSLTHTHINTHTWSSGDTHTHTHTHTPGAVDTVHSHTHINTHTWSSGDTHTHTWSSGHCSFRRSSSTTTACNFIQNSLV